jgi:hypothetical protein
MSYGGGTTRVVSSGKESTLIMGEGGKRGWEVTEVKRQIIIN